jgi:hypothetical protein
MLRGCVAAADILPAAPPNSSNGCTPPDSGGHPRDAGNQSRDVPHPIYKPAKSPVKNIQNTTKVYEQVRVWTGISSI